MQVETIISYLFLAAVLVVILLIIGNEIEKNDEENEKKRREEKLAAMRKEIEAEGQSFRRYNEQRKQEAKKQRECEIGVAKKKGICRSCKKPSSKLDSDAWCDDCNDRWYTANND